MKITILGCGNGAFAAAADLTDRGHEITLYSDESHRKRLEPIMDDRTIRYIKPGRASDITIHKVTCDIEDALEDTELIMPIIPAFSHESAALELSPYLKDGDRIMLVPGSTGGALVFAKIISEHSGAKEIRLSEMHTLPYACRKHGRNEIHVLLEVRRIFFAALPARYNEEMFAVARELYPSCVLVKDVLETSLNNGNATTHPAPVVLNAGKIEYYGRHFHYQEGITRSVAEVIQGIDDERKAVCRAFGYDEIDIKDRLYNMGYTFSKESVYDAIHSSYEIFLPLEGPNDLSGRYLTEDTPCSLVAMSELAAAAGVRTPLMDAVIELGGRLRSENYRETGRTLDRMGIGGMTIDQLRNYLRG